jgi:hypothetical protein
LPLPHNPGWGSSQEVYGDDSIVTITVKGASNRWANFVLGMVGTLLSVYHFFMCGVPLIMPVLFAEPTAHHLLLLGTAVVATALITWNAWRWPEQKA